MATVRRDFRKVMGTWRKLAARLLLPLAMAVPPLGVTALPPVDPTLAADIAAFTSKAKKLLTAQATAQGMQTTGYVWMCDEVGGATSWQRQFNDYLDGFQDILAHAAQIYGFYHEVAMLTRNMGMLVSQIGDNPAGCLAVALSARKGAVYADLVRNAVDIVYDIRTVCLSGTKMTQAERFGVVLGIRPKLRAFNRKLRTLARLARYTSLSDVWLEVTGRGPAAADKEKVAGEALGRWRRKARNVMPR